MPHRYNTGSKSNQQNQIQDEGGESQQDVHESSVEQKLLCLVEGDTSIILQAANAIAMDNYENKFSTVKISLNSGSQQTFISEELAKELNLKPVREVPVDINAFMSNHDVLQNLKSMKLLFKQLVQIKNNFLKFCEHRQFVVQSMGRRLI